MNAEEIHQETKLFDEHGRCLPFNINSPVNIETRRYFIFESREINYNNIYNRIKNHLDPKTKLSFEEFETRSKKILKNLQKEPLTENITKGIGVPFFLPNKSHSDIGYELVNHYLKGLEKSFHETNPKYDFVNHCKEELSNQLTTIPNSRHGKLLDLMQEDVVVGYYYPCMMEYSTPAAIERINSLPSQFLLAGGFDTCSAFIGSPNLLLKTKGYPPLLWMTALKGEREDVGYHIEAYGYNLTFNRRAHLNHVAEYWAHAVVILG
jgi:hypothetical protein